MNLLRQYNDGVAPLRRSSIYSRTICRLYRETPKGVYVQDQPGQTHPRKGMCPKRQTTVEIIEGGHPNIIVSKMHTM